MSYTEAAAIRAWTTGVNDFLAFTKFMPPSLNYSSDIFLTLNASAALDMNMTAFSDGVVETTVWPTPTGSGGVLIRSAAGQYPSGYYVGYNASGVEMTIEVWASTGARTQLLAFDMSVLNCGLVTDGWNMLRVVSNGTSLCVYANPMFIDATDGGIRPRACVNDDTFSSGSVMGVNAGSADAGAVSIDYIGVLPLTVL